MTNYTVEQVEAILNKDELVEPLTDQELELLPLVLDGFSPEGIAERLEAMPSRVTVQKRLGLIYKKLNIVGNGPVKLRKLREYLFEKIEVQGSKTSVLIVWAGNPGQKVSETLSEQAFSHFPGLDMINCSNDLQSKFWYRELIEKLDDVAACFACLSENLYENVLVNAAIGFLNGRIGQCNIITYKENQYELLKNSSLSYFPSIDIKDEKKWAEIIHRLNGQTQEDAEIYMGHGLRKFYENIDDEILLNKDMNDTHANYFTGINSLVNIIGLDSELIEKKYLERLISYIQDPFDRPEPIVSEAISKVKEVRQEVLDDIKKYLNSIENTEKNANEDSLLKIVEQFRDKVDRLKIAALIVRVKDSEDNSEEWLRWGNENVDWDNRDGRKRAPGEGYIQGVMSFKEPRIVPSIKDESSRFKNKDWILENNFMSFASFPLLNGSRDALGTFTMYFLDYYDIEKDKERKKFIECITSLLSNLIIRRKRWEALRELITLDQKNI